MPGPRTCPRVCPRVCLTALFAATLAGVSVPAAAETLQELDALSDATATEQSGIALAMEQAQRGDYLDAISTVERVLAVFPKSHNARLLHAVLLCEIDDKTGGAIEIGKLKKKDLDPGDWQVAHARCGMAEGN